MTAMILRPSEALAETNSWFRLGVLGRIKRGLATLRRRDEYRQSVRDFSACSDHVLKDVGIHRCAIQCLTFEATYGIQR